MNERVKRGSLGIGAHSSTEYMRQYMRLYRKRQGKDIMRQRNRLAYLESEVERLQRSLNHALQR